MKKRLVFISSLILSCLTLAACGSHDKSSDDGSGGDDQPKLSHFEQAISSVSKYDVHLTNGFDYNIIQYYNGENYAFKTNRSIRIQIFCG